MKRFFRAITFGLVLSLNAPAHAISNDQWANISDVGAYGLITVALVTPAIRADWQGLRQSVSSIGVATITSQVLKSVIHERRPDNSDNKSFPSGHSSQAFASATTLYRRYGWEVGFPAYAVATVTASARVSARKHHWYDVVAGAALGSASGWFFTDKFNDQVQLSPWADSKSGGVMLFANW